jgi:hypothetical protein
MSETKEKGQLTQHWRYHIVAWETSVESGASYCKRDELVYHRFQYWRRKFGDPITQKTLVPAQSSGFTQVAMGQAELPDSLTLSLPNGLVIGDIRETNVTVVNQFLKFL